MKHAIISILIILVQQSLIAQSSIAIDDSRDSVSFTLIQRLPINAKFILAYSEDNYWWSSKESIRVLAQNQNGWEAWICYRERNDSIGVEIEKNPQAYKRFKKVKELESSLVNKLLQSLTNLNFWSLQLDSLKQTRGSSISDGTNYRFQIETPNQIRIIESYAPEFYISRYPDMAERSNFLKGKDIFIDWWKRYCR